MKRRFIPFVCGFLMLTLLLPFQAAAAESDSAVEAESSKSGVTMVAGGWRNSLVLKEDGTVWVWGWNGYDQLGDGSMTDRYTPIQVPGLSSVVAIAAGGQFNLALKSDGTVWAWGFNSSGQLGDGTKINRNTPVQVPGLSSVIAVAAGSGLSLALKSDGTVWAWGWNGYGQLGDGSTTDRYNPVQVQSLSSVTAIAAGQYYNLALKSDGTVWAWGVNSNGQLGDGTTTIRSTPVQVPGLSSVTAVAADSNHSLALKSDGTLWAWGYNGYGQLGDGSTTDRNTPVQVPGLSSVTAVAAGPAHSLALKNDGTLWTWGNNIYGQLGDGTTTHRNTPVQVKDLSSVVSIDTDGYHSLVLKSDGTVWAWGWNGYGQLGDGSTTDRYTSVQVQGLDESSPAFYRFEGTILDFDDRSIVWKETGDKVLWLYNRADNSQVKVYDAAGSEYTIHSAKFSTKDVVFTLSITDSSGWPTNRSAYYWNDGNVRKLADGEAYGVKGNYAVFTNRVLDLVTGQSRSLPNSDFQNTNRFDLLADGMVVYTSPTYQSNLYRSFHDGTLTTYVPPSPNYKTYSGALTDGKNIIYKVLIWYTGSYYPYGSYSKWSLRVRNANDEITTLALNPYQKGDDWSDPRISYQINNGWIAYKEYNKEKDHWILYVRSPEGVTKQVFESPDWWSWQHVPLSIKQLGPDGTVAFTFKDKTSLYSFQEEKLLYSFIGPGELQYRNGIWYRMTSNSLFDIQI